MLTSDELRQIKQTVCQLSLKISHTCNAEELIADFENMPLNLDNDKESSKIVHSIRQEIINNFIILVKKEPRDLMVLRLLVNISGALWQMNLIINRDNSEKNQQKAISSFLNNDHVRYWLYLKSCEEKAIMFIRWGTILLITVGISAAGLDANLAIVLIGFGLMLSETLFIMGQYSRLLASRGLFVSEMQKLQPTPHLRDPDAKPHSHKLS